MLTKKSRLLQWICMLLEVWGTLFLLCGIPYLIMASSNWTHCILVVVGAVALWAGIYGKRLENRRGPTEWCRKIWVLSVGVLFIYCVSLLFTTLLICLHAGKHPLSGREALAILGSGLKGDQVPVTLALRLNKALEYLRDNPQCIAVVSGGQGPDEWISEARAMKNYLLTKGIAANRIFEEGRSRNTKENFMYSREVLDQYFQGRPYSCVYVTNDFHSYRAGLYAAKAGLKAESLAAPSLPYTYINYFVRENLALIAYFFLERNY